MISNNNYTGKPEILQDLTPKGKVRPFKRKKINSLKTSESLRRIEYHSRSFRMENCGTHLKYVVCPIDGYRKLVWANFCRDRMCAMCNWRRSLRLTSDIIKIIHHVEKGQKFRYIFLTLTYQRVKSIDLEETINKMYKGFHLLTKRKDVKDITVGFVRTLEITYDKEKLITTEMYNSKKRKAYYKKMKLKMGDKNPQYDTYLPHFHVLLAVKPSYFSTKGGYIKHGHWTVLWKKSLGLSEKETVIVNVKAVKENKETKGIEDLEKIEKRKAVLETAKYSVKDTDYVIENIDEMDKVIKTFANALHCRRLIAFGKLFLKAKKELKIKDIESKDADLVGSDEDKNCSCPICNSDLKEELYRWEYKITNYVKIKKIAKKENID